MPRRSPVSTAAAWPLALLIAALPASASAQLLSQRGFVEAGLAIFPGDAPNDDTRAVGDLLLREEVFAKPASWIQAGAGIDVRANSHDQIDERWRVDFADRGLLRPRVSLRRALATIVRGTFTLDVGKQFIRWGKADIVNPTDRFAPRDFMNVVDAEFMPVTGVRAVVQIGDRDAVDVAWIPRFTPSRLPLAGQRWAPVTPQAAQVQIVDRGAIFPDGAQTGIRWSRTGTRVEYSASFFDGFNHLPDIVLSVPADTPVPEVDFLRTYPALRTYGGDVALPTRWLTVKGEAAFFTSSSAGTDEYVLYVVQLERQIGEWVLIGGYAGEAVTRRRSVLTFAPDRGLTRAPVPRASYTIDPNRQLAFESVVRQSLAGAYIKTEYSQARGQHWRATVSGSLIRGEPDDFLGRYRLNSNLKLVLRYSF